MRTTSGSCAPRSQRLAPSSALPAISMSCWASRSARTRRAPSPGRRRSGPVTSPPARSAARRAGAKPPPGRASRPGRRRKRRPLPHPEQTEAAAPCRPGRGRRRAPRAQAPARCSAAARFACAGPACLSALVSPSWTIPGRAIDARRQIAEARPRQLSFEPVDAGLRPERCVTIGSRSSRAVQHHFERSPRGPNVLDRRQQDPVSRPPSRTHWEQKLGNRICRTSSRPCKVWLYLSHIFHGPGRTRTCIGRIMSPRL